MSNPTPPTPDVMLDLETFGTRPGSVIASIGAVAFNAERGTIGQTFYAVIDVRSCEALGLTLDPSTVLWWLKQSDAARGALTADNAVDLHLALDEFRAFYQRNGGRRLWSHGGNFDEPMISAAFRAIGVAPPWQYWDGRCTRTLFELAGVKPERAEGVHHNALDDALAQARAVIEARKRLALAAEIAALFRAGKSLGA